MMGGYLNADVPPFDCLVRAEFCYNLESHRGEFLDATIFGLASIPGRAIGFHAWLSNGAQVGRLPIHALCWTPEAPRRELDDLELWDCFSPQVSVTPYRALREATCYPMLKTGERLPGRYLFTIDWWGTNEAENPGESGWKCAHVIALEEGNFCALPNNRIFPWCDPATVHPPKSPPAFRTNEHIWKCEGETKWKTSNDDRMFYGVEEGE